MRLTVGPLPSAVYWRRRVVVLAAPLAVIVLGYAACAPDGDDKKAPMATTSTAPPGLELTPTALPALSSAAPTGAPGSSGGAGSPGPLGVAATGGAPAAPPGLGGPACDDGQLMVAPAPAKSSVPAASPIDIRLIVENSSGRACLRDVGADAQELRIVRGVETIWSSDHCGSGRGQEPRSFAAGERLEYMVTWNGRSSTMGDKCRAGVPVGPVTPGAYQLLARVGSKVSEPVELTLTAS
ncbi:hypothetical protein [Pilimelia columellifera]|uniref:Uncharacterized protein n=1 Tax=Pilimelia columellifera subsp. columellifera TaxID=706583 RepID=A0ABP6AMV8_9ACTN